MVHVLFNPNSVNLINYKNQYGGNYYLGISRQRGAGLGDFLRVLWRYVTPILKDVGVESLKSGSLILDEIGKGKNIKQTIKTQGRNAAANLLQKTSSRLRSQEGSGIKKKKQNNIIRNKNFPVGRSVLKNPKDIFYGL